MWRLIVINLRIKLFCNNIRIIQMTNSCHIFAWFKIWCIDLIRNTWCFYMPDDSTDDSDNCLTFLWLSNDSNDVLMIRMIFWWFWWLSADYNDVIKKIAMSIMNAPLGRRWRRRLMPPWLEHKPIRMSCPRSNRQSSLERRFLEPELGCVK